jgi:hypothetical protein
MADEVWPSTEQPVLTSFNGIGQGLRGFTRVDAGGRCFATRWLLVAGLPVVPLTRYYLREYPQGAFRVDGESRLRAVEVVRAYVYWWLVVPAVGILPMLAAAHRLRQVESMSTAGTWWAIGGFVLWVVLVLTGLVTLRQAYRKHWAPVREVVWVDPPPSVLDWPDDRLPPAGWRYGDD